MRNLPIQQNETGVDFLDIVDAKFDHPDRLEHFRSDIPVAQATEGGTSPASSADREHAPLSQLA